ncbi:hypothetical protein VTN31DRAFT_5751 [Thermomyces dupontii]|uniref:uncharacterized protein n=1 Tax=Talaromyces thermophilus TaxID=28565 RepID=UPI003743C21E
MSNNPEHNDPSRQGQYPPPQWNGSTQPESIPSSVTQPPPPTTQISLPPSSSLPQPPPAEHDRQRPPYQYPPPSTYSVPPPPLNMASVHPQSSQPPHDLYRLPPPPGAYQRPPDMYAQPPQPLVYQAPAPRQRTAIACRYCRRRKIRCSGFENSQDGRCSNCIRFNQECMFTPVSSQAQAFVPAHAAYPHLRNQAAGRGRAGYPGDGVVLYGAHGQPLPPQQQPQSSTTLPPPHGLYYGRPMDERGPPPPLTHHLNTDQRQQPPGGRRGSGSGFEYPEPTNLAPVSPAVSTPTYSSGYYPAPGPDRRPSPYDRNSSQPYPPITATPPPVSTASTSRPGLNVRDILNPGDQPQGGRSSTDTDMVNALNRRV